MASLGQALKAEIERWVDQLRQTPLYDLAQRGALSPAAVALYLESLRYLFQHSQANLAFAARCAANAGDPALAGYLARKAGEEQGHDAWAEQDLAQLPLEVTRGARVARAVVELAALQRALIAKHPICFVAYAQWAEYFTVLVGDEWLEGLAKSGFGAGKVTAISKHVDADRAHAANGFAEIDALWSPAQSTSEEILQGIATAEHHFVAFCDEVYHEAHHRDERR